MKEILNDADYSEAARLLDCDTAAIKAVAEVESSGRGFFEDDSPKILFEAHIFSKLTKHIYDKTHPDISSRKWNKALYIGGLAEYERLNKAMTLNPEAALKSASWGKFQIMGFNHALCGYKDVSGFVEAMKASERDHLLAFISFLKILKLDRFLRSKDWAKFSEGYNGSGFRQNKYDIKLAKAFDKYSQKA